MLSCTHEVDALVRASRRRLVFVLVASGLAGAAIAYGLFRESRPAKQLEIPAARNAPPATPDLLDRAPPLSVPIEAAESRATLYATLRTAEPLAVTLQVIARERAFPIPCAPSAISTSLARVEARGGSRVALAVPADLPLVLLASVRGDEIARWTASVPPIAQGASVDIEVAFPRAPVSIHGVVLDRATSRPIPGATIESTLDGRVLSCLSTTSGSDGAFTLNRPPSELHIYTGVRAPGYARRELPRDTSADPDSRLVVELDAGATLAVSVRRSDGSPVAGMEIHAWLPFEGPTGAVHMPVWTAVTDAAGLSELAELPANARLRLALYRAGRELREEPSVPELLPGERRQVAIQLAEGVRVLGRLVDPSGQAVPGIPVRIRSASSPALLSLVPSTPFSEETITDLEGRFVFEDMLPGLWQIGPVAPAEGLPAEVAPVAQPVQIAAGAREVEVTILAYRGLSIAGEVVDPAGRPAGGVLIVAAGADVRGTSMRATSDASGRFVLGPLWPTTYSVSASGPPSSSVRARPGDTRVIVRLDPVGDLGGVVIDARTGAPVSATVHLTSAESPRSITVFSGDGGAFSARNLRPGRWNLSARTPTQRAELRDVLVRAGEIVGSLELRMEITATLEVVSSQRNARLRVADAQGFVLCETLAVEPSRAWTCLVPPGIAILTQYDPASGATEQVEVTLRRGEQRRVRFGLAPR